MSDQYQLATPPIFDTDIPTSEQFYTHTIGGYPAYDSVSYTTFAGNVGPPATGLSWSYYATLFDNTESELRALNPLLSTNNPGDAISIGIFESGTSFFFPNPGLAFHTHHYAAPPPVHNFSQRYAVDAPGIIAMDTTPAGHGPNRQGIWACYVTQDGSYGGMPTLRVAFHVRTPSVKAYTTQWQTLADFELGGDPDVNNVGNRSYGQVAAQRLGNYVYIFGFHTKTTVTSYTDPDSSGSVFPARYDQYGQLRVIKIGPDGTSTDVVNASISSAGQDPATGTTRVPIFGLDYVTTHTSSLSVEGRTNSFVSDDATPFIWHTSGDISDSYDNGPVAWVQGWADNGSGPGSALASNDGHWHVSGQLGAFLQRFVLPSGGQYGFGPYLVHTWAAGNYGAPELWFFMQVGTSGSTFDIYRSRWTRGAYVIQSGVILADDSDFNSGIRRFPALNPDGWAYEQDWFDAAHKVGRIGPFPGADVYNPLTGFGVGFEQIRYPYFRVLRDKKRIGQMHTVFGDGAVGLPSE